MFNFFKKKKVQTKKPKNQGTDGTKRNETKRNEMKRIGTKRIKKWQE